MTDKYPMSSQTPDPAALQDALAGSSVPISFYFRALWRRKWLVLGVLILALGIGAGYTRMQPKVYTANAQLRFSSRSSGAFRSGMEEGPTGSFVDQQASLIRRLPFLRDKVVNDAEIASELAGSEMVKDKPTDLEKAQALAERLTVTRDRGANILGITVKGEDKQLITDIVNKIADAHQKRIMDERESGTTTATREYEEKMKVLQGQINDTETKIWNRANSAALTGLHFSEQQKDAAVILETLQRREDALRARRAELLRQRNEGLGYSEAILRFENLCQQLTDEGGPADSGSAPVAEDTSHNEPDQAGPAIWAEARDSADGQAVEDTRSTREDTGAPASTERLAANQPEENEPADDMTTVWPTQADPVHEEPAEEEPQKALAAEARSADEELAPESRTEPPPSDMATADEAPTEQPQVSVADTLAEISYPSAADIAAIWLKLHKATSEAETDELTRERDAKIRELRQAQKRAREISPKREQAEARLAALEESTQRTQQMLDIRLQSFEPEGAAKDPECVALRKRIELLKDQAETQRKELEAMTQYLAAIGAEAEKVSQLQQADANVQAHRLSQQIYEQAEQDIQEQLDALSEPLTDIRNHFAVLSRLKEDHQRMEDWIREVELALSSVDVRVDEAYEPTEPISPSWPLNMAFASTVGLFAGAGVAILLELSRKTIKTPADVRHALGVRPLGILPHYRALDVGRKVLNPNAIRDPIVLETIGELRSSVLAAANRRNVKSFLITSTTAGEGKSTVATLLALAFARGGERTLLVDSNIRLPYLHAVFDAPPTPGLSNLLRAGTNGQSCLRRTSHPYLSLVPAGQAAPDGLSWLHPTRFEEFISAAGEHFDRVVVDCTSTIGVADVRMMATKVDSVLYVVQADRRKRTLISRGVESIRHSGAGLVGVILNNATYTKGDPYHFRKRIIMRKSVEDPGVHEEAMVVTPAARGDRSHISRSMVSWVEDLHKPEPANEEDREETQ